MSDLSSWLEVTEGFSMCQINLLGRILLDVSLWWKETFTTIYVSSDWPNQAQGEANLAKTSAEMLASSSTHSASDAYTCWHWVFRGFGLITCTLIVAFTGCQGCYFLICSQCTSTHAALVLSLPVANAARNGTIITSRGSHVQPRPLLWPLGTVLCLSHRAKGGICKAEIISPDIVTHWSSVGQATGGFDFLWCCGYKGTIKLM